MDSMELTELCRFRDDGETSDCRSSDAMWLEKRTPQRQRRQKHTRLKDLKETTVTVQLQYGALNFQRDQGRNAHYLGRNFHMNHPQGRGEYCHTLHTNVDAHKERLPKSGRTTPSAFRYRTALRYK
jgi:hypothetical protein